MSQAWVKNFQALRAYENSPRDFHHLWGDQSSTFALFGGNSVSCWAKLFVSNIGKHTQWMEFRDGIAPEIFKIVRFRNDGWFRRSFYFGWFMVVVMVMVVAVGSPCAFCVTRRQGFAFERSWTWKATLLRRKLTARGDGRYMTVREFIGRKTRGISSLTLVFHGYYDHPKLFFLFFYDLQSCFCILGGASLVVLYRESGIRLKMASRCCLQRYIGGWWQSKCLEAPNNWMIGWWTILPTHCIISRKGGLFVKEKTAASLSLHFIFLEHSLNLPTKRWWKMSKKTEKLKHRPRTNIPRKIWKRNMSCWAADEDPLSWRCSASTWAMKKP